MESVRLSEVISSSLCVLEIPLFLVYRRRKCLCGVPMKMVLKGQCRRVIQMHEDKGKAKPQALTLPDQSCSTWEVLCEKTKNSVPWSIVCSDWH